MKHLRDANLIQLTRLINVVFFSFRVLKSTKSRSFLYFPVPTCLMTCRMLQRVMCLRPKRWVPTSNAFGEKFRRALRGSFLKSCCAGTESWTQPMVSRDLRAAKGCQDHEVGETCQPLAGDERSATSQSRSSSGCQNPRDSYCCCYYCCYKHHHNIPQLYIYNLYIYNI